MTTPVHSKATVIYHDGFRLSTIVSKASQEVSVTEAEYTALEDAAGMFAQGKPSGKVSATGFLDITETTGWDTRALAAQTDGIHLWTCYPAGTVALQPAYLFRYQVTSQPRTFDQAQVAMIDNQGTITGAMSRGVSLLAPVAVTGTGATTGQNLGVTASTDRFIAHVMLQAVSGTGSITVEIEESSDDGSGDAYATISGMSGTLTTVGTATRLSFTGATEAWKRVNVTAFSGFTSVTIAVAVGTAI